MAAVLVCGMVMGGCVRPYVSACRDIAQDEQGDFKYNKRQAAIACERAHLYADAQLTSYDRAKSQWKLNPNGVLTDDLKQVLEDQAKSLDLLLSYRDREDADFIDWFKGFREGLEKQESIVLAILGRLNYVKTYNEFTDLVGELPARLRPSDASYFFPAGRKFYSPRLLYMIRSLEVVPFTAEYLETAKQNGTLKLVDTFDLRSVQQFAKKVSRLYDPNDFTWEKQDRGLALKAYRVMPDNEKPADNVVHYMEIFRYKPSGYQPDGREIEEKPAVRGFLAAGGSTISVFVIDYDREGMPGYGSPDAVIRTYSNVTTGADIFTNPILREKILDALYDISQKNNVRERPERRKPQDRTIYTAIVKMGETQVDVWEQGTWSVPFDYKNLSQNLRIEFKKPETADEKRVEEQDKIKQTRVLVREFSQSGTKVVLEYWTPKDEYAGRNIAHASVSGDTFKMRRKNGPEETGEIGYFGKGIRTIDYFFGGRWFRIIDENGDGVFEKKRNIADPTASSYTGSAQSSDVDG